MSRSNYDKPFYVDVGTSIVAIRCASNHDVVCGLDHTRSEHSIKLIEEKCERMNKEFELSAKRISDRSYMKSDWSVKNALDFANALANHGWTRGANTDVASSCIYSLCRMLKECREAIDVCMKQMCDRCRTAESYEKHPVPCLYGCEALNKAKAALEGGAE